ncbi:MAG: signal peptidase II [Clostridia bacterium]|nr:signal peptidase II [Clostridia bacterium]
MRLRRGCRGWWIALLAAAVDRITKVAVLRLWQRPRLLDRTFDALIPGVVNLRMVGNHGMAFSLFSGQGAALTVLTFLLIAGVVAWLIARPGESKWIRTGFWLVVGGGLGNLFDRVVQGYVVDFIELAFVRFAVFNVADVCICVGAALVILGTIFAERQKRRERHGRV